MTTTGLADGVAGRGEPAHAERAQSAWQQRERVEPAGTERVAAPETRVKPSGRRDSVAPAMGSPVPSTAAQEAGAWGQTPPSPPALPATPATSPAASAARGSAGQPAAEQETTRLFAGGEAQHFHNWWNEVQTGFVDDPRRAVEQAEHLIADVMKRLPKVFADERAKLERQRSQGDGVSTEDLRVALRRYRSFVTRLLSV